MAETETASSSNGQQSSNGRAWIYVGVFIAGIAVILLFFIFSGVPDSFDSLVHRNDSAWQKLNNPTTTTTIHVAPPLDDAFADEFQSKLDEAVAALKKWDSLDREEWDSFSDAMQAAYDPYAIDVIPMPAAVVDCVDRFYRLSLLWRDLYGGDLIDVYEAEVTWERYLESTEPMNWHRLGTDARDLLGAMREQLDTIDTILLWTVNSQGYRLNPGDTYFIRSWLNVRDDIEGPLSHAQFSLDSAYTAWYLAIDKAQRP